MSQVEEDQTPAIRNRHRESASLWRESKNASSCAEEESPLESGAQRRDSEEENQEEERGSTSCAADAVQLGEGITHPASPDGGWGWVVLVATMLVLSLTLAFPSCIGIFYTDLQTEFSASNTETSWVLAIMTAMLHAGGPFCSMLVERFGCRVTVMLGGLLSGLGMAVSALARTLTDVYITSGITGLGLCFSFQPSVTIMGHYFVRCRVFANALSSTGTAVGLSVLPLIANVLLSRFGWRGSFLILGGVLLNCCVCGAVMRPVASGPNRPRPSQVLDEPDNISLQQETKGLKDSVKTVCHGFIAFLHRHMAFDLLLSNPRYRAFAVGVTWMMPGCLVPLVYFVPYATHHNMEISHAAFLMSVLGLVNIAVRPTAAFVLGLPRFRGSRSFVYVFASAALANGLSNCICGVSASFEALLAYVVIYGLSMGLGGSLLYTVLMGTVEMSRFASALGLVCMLESGTMLIGPPLAGMLVDHTGQYSYVFYACSVCVVSASLFLAGFFYFLDGRTDGEEEEESAKMPSELYQKPVVILAPDCQYVSSKGDISESTVSLHVDSPPHKPSLTSSYVHGTSSISLLPLTVSQSLESTVQRWPDREAVVFLQDGIRKTFAQFQQDVEKMAAGLLALGLKRGDRLEVWGPNTHEWILFQFATAKAGIILVSLNPAYQVNEVEFTLKKVQCKAVVCPTQFKTQNFCEMLREICPEIDGTPAGMIKSSRVPDLRVVIVTDSRQPGMLHVEDVMQAGESRHHRELMDLQRKLSFDDPINIQFTSGTTGSPKGATLSHFNIVNNAYFAGLRMDYGSRPQVRVCVPVPLYHCFGSVMAGMSMAVHGVTLVYCFLATTVDLCCFTQDAMLYTALPQCSPTCSANKIYTSMICHQLKLASWELLHALLRYLWKYYGTTENNSITFMGFPQDNEELKINTAGCIMSHTEAKVVDPVTREIVPLGVSGELMIRGSCVMHGYWDDPEKTRQAICQAGWYRTGDIASLNSLGYCRIEGRLKDMII